MLTAAVRGLNPLRGPPPGGGTRGIHFNAYIPRSNPPRSNPVTSTYQYYYAQASRITQSARRFFTRLLEPSVPAHVHGGHQTHLTLQGLAQFGVHRHPNPILRNLSPTNKFSLALSPVSRVYLPRGPQGFANAGYRGLAQEVGLGTARKFSTGRTVFHHVIEKNASVGVRAFLEMDAGTDLRTVQVSRTRARKSENKSKKEMKKTILIKPTVTKPKEEEVAQYFKQEEPEVITYLQIALASTPSAHMPFATIADGSIDAAKLLPLRAILSSREAFQAQTTFVSRLFNRMDQRDVWNSPKGRVNVESWGDSGGLCTELRVRFEGWSEEDVRTFFSGLLIDEGTGGWAIQELHRPKLSAPKVLQSQNYVLSPEPDSIPASMLASPALSTRPESEMEMDDPWLSESRFIMPQLDFSATFPAFTSPPSAILDDSFDARSDTSTELDHLSDTLSDTASDAWSDGAESSDPDGSNMSMPSVVSINDLSSSRVMESVSGWIGFSSDFLGRVRDETNVFA